MANVLLSTSTSSNIVMKMIMFLVVCNMLVHQCLCYQPGICGPKYPKHGCHVCKGDVDMMQFAENLEHLEADFFLWGGFGYGLDYVAPELVMGGPPPIGPRKANLDRLTQHIIREFGLEEVGHLRY